MQRQSEEYFDPCNDIVLRACRQMTGSSGRSPERLHDKIERQRNGRVLAIIDAH